MASSSDAEVGTHEFTWTIKDGFVNYGNIEQPFCFAVAGFNGINNNGLLAGTSYIHLSPHRAAFARVGDTGPTNLLPPVRNSGWRRPSTTLAQSLVIKATPRAGVQVTIFKEDGSFEPLGSLWLEESWAIDVNQSDVIVGWVISFGAVGALIPNAFG